MFVKTKRSIALLMVLTILFAFAQPVSATMTEQAVTIIPQIETLRKLQENGSQAENWEEHQALAEKYDLNEKRLSAQELADKDYAEADVIFDAIDALEESPARRNLSQTKMTDAVAELVEASDGYSEASLERNGNVLTWWTDGGVRCIYNPRMQKIQKNLTPENGEDLVVNEPKSTKAVTPSGRYVYLIGPYYGYDDSFTNQYKGEAQNIADAIDHNPNEYILYSGAAATIDKVAEAVTKGAVIIFDSHGMTDYENPQDERDCVTGATNSYLCLTTAEGITDADYAAGAVYDGQGAWVNGATIANHMNGEVHRGIIWMAQCYGMATDTICNPLREKGIEVVCGYSQAVTFGADYLYEEVFWNQMRIENNVGAAVATMKKAWGSWELSDQMAEVFEIDSVAKTIDQARENYYAFPVVVSDQDPYPGQRGKDDFGADALQNVQATYYLGQTQEEYHDYDPAMRYHREVWNYVGDYGTLDEYGNPMLAQGFEDENSIYYYTLKQSATNLKMSCLIVGKGATRVDAKMEVYLGDIDSFSGTLNLELYDNNQLLEKLTRYDSSYRQNFDKDRDYHFNGSKYFDSATLSEFYTVMIHSLFSVWDYSLYESMGFGMKCLGFVNYEGLGDSPCNHTYSNGCDPTCNECGVARPVPHMFSNTCDTECGRCGIIRPIEHTYTYRCDPSCSVCGDIRVVIHVYEDGVCIRCYGDDPNYGRIPGDITDDDAVNNEDVALLLWHTLFPEDYPLQ